MKHEIWKCILSTLLKLYFKNILYVFKFNIEKKMKIFLFEFSFMYLYRNISILISYFRILM